MQEMVGYSEIAPKYLINTIIIGIGYQQFPQMVNVLTPAPFEDGRN